MSFRKVFVMVAALAALGVAAGAAFAQTTEQKALVDAAKDRGVVGEQSDGFLGFRQPSSDSALNTAVRLINNGRRAEYARRAAELGIAPEVMGTRAFETVVSIRTGQWYRNAQGQWVQR